MSVKNKIDESIKLLEEIREELTKTDTPKESTGFTRYKALKAAKDECNLNLNWKGSGAAKKYTKKFEGVFGKGRFPWCAAFVTWCCEQAGLNVPIKAPHTNYTFALCEAWQEWAMEEDFYHDQTALFVPRAGDIVLFDWDQVNVDEKDADWEDHIGFFMHRDGPYYICAEGNYKDATGFVKRKGHHIQGFIRIPDSYSFK